VISGRKSGAGTGSQSTSVFPCQNPSTKSPYSSSSGRCCCDGKDKDAKTGNPQKEKVVWEIGEIHDRLACLDAAEMKTFSCCCFTTNPNPSTIRHDHCQYTELFRLANVYCIDYKRTAAPLSLAKLRTASLTSPSVCGEFLEIKTYRSLVFYSMCLTHQIGTSWNAVSSQMA
jgi:hypothetical protein